MRVTRTRRLAGAGVTTLLVATMLALVSVTMPSAEAAPGKVPDGPVTFTTLSGAFNIGGGSINLPVRHPNSPNECADGIDNELGEMHGGAAGATGTPAKDGLVDFAGSGTTGYSSSNGGEATTTGLLHNFPKGCTSLADDLELGGHVYGFRPTCIPFAGCLNGLNLPDPQPRQFFDIDATVAGNNITIAAPGDVSVPDNILLFGSCSGTICANYIAQIKLTATDNEVQELRVNATGGTYTLTFGANTTAPIAYNAPPFGAGSVDAALEALPNIGVGGVSVTGGLGADGGLAPYRITFTGGLANTDVAQVTANSAGLTGGGAVATTSTLRNGAVNLDGTAENDGSGTLDLGFDVSLNLFKTIDSADLAPFSAVCATSLQLNLTTGTSGTLTGNPYDTARQMLTVVDGQFTMPPFVETQNNPIGQVVCDGANDALGLWDGSKVPSNLPGDNEVRINASTSAGPWDVAGTDIVADAGPNQVVNECDTIVLDGTNSYNEARATPTVGWSQSSGPDTQFIKNADQLVAQTVAPPGDNGLIFDLDYETLIGPHPTNTRTDTDAVNVTVNNVAPVANAGADFATSTGKAAVALDGFADDACTETPDLVTTWSQTGGPAVPIADTSSVDTTFDTTGLASATTLTFQLAVDDGTDVTTDSVTVTVRAPASGTISGVVRNTGGSPLANIDARVYQPGSGFVTKAATAVGTGAYSVGGLSNGTQYAVLFNDPAGASQAVWFRQSTNWDDREIVTAPDAAVDGTMVSELSAASLSGTVTDADTGAPLAGVLVALHDANGAGFVWDAANNKVVRGQAITNGAGQWTIDGLNPGDHYRVRYQLAGYNEQWNSGKSWGWTADEISVGTTDVTGLDAALTAKTDRATLSGTVTNGDTGANEIQTITVTSGSTRSMYDVTYGAETIRVEATQSAVDLQTDLERLPGLAGNILVQGSPGAYTVEFVNGLGKTNVSQIAVTSLSEVQTLRVSATTGTFTLTFNGQTTAAIAFSAPAATVQTALEALSNIAPGDISVTGGIGEQQGDAPYQIAFLDGGAYGLQDVPEMVATTVTGPGINTQGSFVETARGGSTVSSGTSTGGVPESPLQNVEVRVYSATAGKYVLLDDTSVSGAYSMLLPLDVYRIRFVDPVNGKTWEWYDNLRTPTAATPAYLVADTVDLSAAGATATVNASLSA